MQTLININEKLSVQNAAKHDMVIPAGKLIFTNSGKIAVIDEKLAGEFDPTGLFHEQMADKLGIPMRYYRRMQAEKPELLAENINQWLKDDPAQLYMVRAFKDMPGAGNVARAFLSDRYNCIDNYDVLFAALEAIKSMGVQVDITKAEVTDTRLYLHVVCPSIERDAEAFLKQYLKENDAAGNGIISGFVISNSEVGKGSFEIRPRAVICKCNNGLVLKDEKFSRIHLGGKLEEGVIQWSQETKKKNMDLIMSQTKDAVSTFLSSEYLGKMITKIAELNNIKLDHPVDAVQNVCKELMIEEAHRKSIMDFFIKDGDHNASGILHAVTRAAQQMDPDTQYEIESGVFELLSGTASRFDKPYVSKN